MEAETTETKSPITSGDWKVHNAFARYEIRPDGARKNVAEVYEESDAHIIAASKDMYEALKEILLSCKPTNVTSHYKQKGMDLGEYYVGGCGIPSDKAIHLLVNALAKAEGK